MLPPLLGHQVARRDRDLLIHRVPGELDHLHAIEEDAGDAAEVVGRGDEDDPREVVVDAEVVVGEGVVLLGIERLEERRGWIAADAGAAELVDLVEDDHGVPRARPLHRLDQPAGEGADVGPAVPADLGVVADAPQRDADEAPAQGLGDATPERGLADPGRAGEAEDRRPLVRGQLAHAQVLEDAPLDLLEAVVLGVEEPAGRGEIEAVGGLGRRAPRQLRQPLEVGAGDHRLAALAVHPAEARHLPVGGSLGVGGQLRPIEALLELAEGALLLLALGLAELLLDRPQLVAEHGVVLVLGEVLADRAVEVALDLEDVGAVRDQLDHPAQALADPRLGEDLGALVVVEIDVTSAEIGEEAGAPLAGQRRQRLSPRLGLRRRGQEGVVLLDQIGERSGEGVRQRRIGDVLDDPGEADLLPAPGVDHLVQVDAGEAAEDRGDPPGHPVEELDDLGEDGDRLERLQARARALGLPLDRDDHQVRGGIAAGLIVGVLDRVARRRDPAELERRGRPRQDQDGAEGEEGEDPGADSVVRHETGERSPEPAPHATAATCPRRPGSATSAP